MWNTTDKIHHNEERKRQYQHKVIEEWDGDDCLEWAADVENESDIPLSKWISIDAFKKVFGKELLHYSENDFRKLVDHNYGPLFFASFRKFMKKKLEENAQMKNGALPCLTATDFNTWSMIQDCSTYRSSSMTDILIDPQDGQDLPLMNSAQPSFPTSPEGWNYRCCPSAVSPVEAHSWYASHDVENLPFTGSAERHQLSKSQDAWNHRSSPSIGSIREEELWDNVGRNLASPNPPPINSINSSGMSVRMDKVCGGTCSYGEPFTVGSPPQCCSTCSYGEPEPRSVGSAPVGHFSGYVKQAELNRSFDSTASDVGEIETLSGFIPDFNTLLIQDGSCRDDCDIEDINLNFKPEDFENLDQYLDSSFTQQDFSCFDDFPELPNCRCNEDVFSHENFQDKILKKIITGKRGNRVRHPQSWEFLVRLLMDETSNPSLIRWEDKQKGIFRLVKKEEIARLWGRRSDKHKNEPLSYDNFARILRYHYKSKVLLPVSDRHLVYKLGDQVLRSLRAQGIL